MTTKKLKTANKMVGLLVQLNDLDRSYTLINSSILKVCSGIHASDPLETLEFRVKVKFSHEGTSSKILPKTVRSIG